MAYSTGLLSGYTASSRRKRAIVVKADTSTATMSTRSTPAAPRLLPAPGL